MDWGWGGGWGRFKLGPFLYRKYKRGEKSLMFLHRVNNIEHNKKTKYLYWHGGNLSYTSMILYIKQQELRCTDK